MIGSRSPWAANRRGTRPVRVARSTPSIWPIFHLSFALLLLCALALVGTGATVLGEEEVLRFPAYLIRNALLLGLAGFAVLVALVSLRIFLIQHRREARIDVPSARDFLAGVAQSDEEYVLLLHPREPAANLFLPVARGILHRLRDPANECVALEQLITMQARDLLGLRTVAIAYGDEVAPGPDYVTVEDEGERGIEALIARAHSVFVLVLPGEATADRSWELAEVFRKGLVGRAAVLLPPRHLKHSAQVAELTAAVIPHAAEAERAALADYLLGEVILAHLREEPEFWCDSSARFGAGRSTSRAYAEAIAECLHDMDATIPPRGARYPYFHTVRARMAPRLAIVPPAIRSSEG